MYLNGLRAEDITRIRVDLDNDDPHAYVYADYDSTSAQIGAYLQADTANLESALAAFIATVSYPWIAVGSISAMPWTNGTHGILAVNLDHSDFSMTDEGTGINFYGGSGPYVSFGYAPWSDFSAAQAAIQDLQGSITWSLAS